MRLAYIGSLVVVVVLATLPAHRHHSFGGTYNVDQKITIKGKIAQVTLRSPHSFVYVEVENGDGSVERWTGAKPDWMDAGLAELAPAW